MAASDALKRQYWRDKASSGLRQKRDDLCAAIDADRKSSSQKDRLLAASEALGIGALKSDLPAAVERQPLAEPEHDSRAAARHDRLMAASAALGIDVNAPKASASVGSLATSSKDSSDVGFIKKFTQYQSDPTLPTAGGGASASGHDIPGLRTRSASVAAAAMLSAAAPAHKPSAAERQLLLPPAPLLSNKRTDNSAIHVGSGDMDEVRRKLLEKAEAAGLKVGGGGAVARTASKHSAKPDTPRSTAFSNGGQMQGNKLANPPINAGNKWLSGDSRKASANILAGATAQLRIGHDTMRMRESSEQGRIRLEDEKVRANDRAAELNSVLGGLTGPSASRHSSTAAQLTHSHWSGMRLGGQIPSNGQSPGARLQRVDEDSQADHLFLEKEDDALARFVNQAGTAALNGAGKIEQLRNEGAHIKRLAAEVAKDTRRLDPFANSPAPQAAMEELPRVPSRAYLAPATLARSPSPAQATLPPVLSASPGADQKPRSWFKWGRR